MIVVDTSALIALLAREPEESAFLRILLMERECLIGAPTLFEYRMVAQNERIGATAVMVESILALAPFRIEPWTGPLVSIAQDAFTQYGKGRHRARLNFGDCMSYALAKSLDAPLLYKGDDFAKTDIRSAVQ